MKYVIISLAIIFFSACQTKVYETAPFGTLVCEEDTQETNGKVNVPCTYFQSPCKQLKIFNTLSKKHVHLESKNTKGILIVLKEDYEERKQVFRNWTFIKEH